MRKEDKTGFIKGYIVCALWSTGDDEYESFVGMPVSIGAVLEMGLQCEAFLDKHRELVERATGCVGYDYNRAGHDFWLTRNGHGTGYWERDELPEDLAEALTRAAKAEGCANLYLSDNGEVCAC